MARTSSARRTRNWLWVALFIWVAILIGSLATGWNIVLVRDYHRKLELARLLPIPIENNAPWPILILGTLGFAAALATMVLFFVKVLREIRRNQIQSDFLAAVTHELKTPIASLQLSSSLLRNGDLPAEESARLWNSHDTELARLREDVEALLEAARIGAKGARARRSEPIELESWLSQSTEHWKSLLGPKSALERRGPPLRSRIHVDPQALGLIADNLVTNARKFARGTPELIVRTEQDGRRWKIHFEDRGWGFDPKDSGKLFERFFRGRTEAPYAIPGTGLGLYLAKSAARDLRLELTGSSTGTGSGAVFTLEGTSQG